MRQVTQMEPGMMAMSIPQWILHYSCWMARWTLCSSADVKGGVHSVHDIKTNDCWREVGLSPQEVGGVLLFRTTFSQRTARVPWSCILQQPSPPGPLRLGDDGAAKWPSEEAVLQGTFSVTWAFRCWQILRDPGCEPSEENDGLSLLHWLSHRCWAIIPWQICGYQCALILNCRPTGCSRTSFCNAWKMGDHSPKVLVK